MHEEKRVTCRLTELAYFRSSTDSSRTGPAPPVPPNTPTVPTRHLLEQYGSRHSEQWGSEHWLKAEAPSRSQPLKDEDISDEGKRVDEGEEGDEVQQWELWRARTLANQPPAAPVFLSLLTRRLPPQADGRSKTTRRPLTKPPPQYSAASSTDAGGCRLPSRGAAPAHASTRKPHTAGAALGAGTRRARTLNLRSIRSVPTIAEAQRQFASSKFIPSDVTEDDGDMKYQNARERATKLFLRERLARLHPSDELFDLQSESSSQDLQRRRSSFEKQKERCSPEINKDQTEVHNDVTRCEDESTMKEIVCRKTSSPLRRGVKDLERRSSKEKQRRDSKVPSTSRSSKDIKDHMTPNPLVTSVHSGLLSYLPITHKLSGSEQKYDKEIMNSQRSSQYIEKSSIKKKKVSMKQRKPREEILTHPIPLCVVRKQINQCPLRKLIETNNFSENFCSSQLGYFNSSVISSTVPSDKQITSQFDLSRVKDGSKLSSSFVSKEKSNFEDIKEIRMVKFPLCTKRNKTISSIFEANKKSSMTSIITRESKIKIKSPVTSVNIRSRVKNDNQTKHLNRYKDEDAQISAIDGSSDIDSMEGKSAGILKSEKSAVIPEEISYRTNNIDQLLSRALTFSRESKIKLSPPRPKESTKCYFDRLNLVFLDAPSEVRTESLDGSSITPTTSTVSINKSDENLPSVQTCLVTSYVGEQLKGRNTMQPEEVKSENKSLIPRKGSNMCDGSQSSSRSDVNVLRKSRRRLDARLRTTERIPTVEPFPSQPNYALLKPPWPKSDGKDILLKPPPRKCPQETRCAARNKALLCACEISKRLAAISPMKQCKWKCPGESTNLQYLRRRLAQEKAALRFLGPRGGYPIGC